MRGKIFLSGGGDVKDTEELDKKFFDCLKNNSKILYIPVALDRDFLGFEACFDWFSDVISHNAKNKDIDFSMRLSNDEVPPLEEYEAVYIGGGNTFKLLDYVLSKELDEKLREYLNGGGIVYGGSAGAIIFGKDIRTVEEENDKNYKNFLGLNYVNGLSLVCHYAESLDNKIFDSVKNINGKIVALAEGAGLIVSDNKTEIIAKPLLFSKKKKQEFEV